jgi:hypothetical protein
MTHEVVAVLERNLKLWASNPGGSLNDSAKLDAHPNLAAVTL